ncbi:hypothetical protein [uncultured Clostridium sp.]|uniref:hypothetical protein n=1 Tax=uncultured Clostridium sp. TaxID=59620 RepID=UPI0025E74C1B|nr:hypothetical protein [uncultured Clostridium sp.]
MSSVLIINLGSNDLKIKENCIIQLKELYADDEEMQNYLKSEDSVKVNFRDLTKKLVDEFPKGIEFVEFPLIKAALNKLKKELGEDNLEKIILMSTNQDHTKDTHYLGMLVKKIHDERKDKSNIGLNEFSRLPKIQISSIKENPADYDLMIARYKNEIKKLNDISNLYVEITGGTPAMAFALIYNSTYESSGCVKPFYVNRNMTKAITLKVSDSLRKKNIVNQLKMLVKNRDYKGVQIILENNRQIFSNELDTIEVIDLFIKAATSRIEFDFKSAEEYIDIIIDKNPESREVCNEFNRYITNILKDDIIYILNELKDNALYKYENGAYTDFLGRIFRTQEDIYGQILKKLGFVNIDSKRKIRIIEDSLTNEQKTYLNNTEFQKGEPLNYLKCELNTESMRIILEYLLNENDSENELFKMCTKLKNLKKLRNESILAHGFNGVNEENIKKVIGDINKFLNDLIAKYIEVFDVKLYTDDFYSIDGKFNKYLLTLIEEI